MRDSRTATEELPVTDSADESCFASIETSLRAEGTGAALTRLIEHLTVAGEYRALLDALLLEARQELGLPRVAPGSLADLAEPVRSQYEEKYIAAIRLVGSKYLAAGDIPTAWAFYRAIGENEPVAAAIRAYRPSDNDEKLGAIIEVAFNHGVSPESGFELILNHYGTCPAISSFEQLPAHEEKTRAACAARLIRRLHRELTANLRSEIAARGQVPPPEDRSLAELVWGNPWLFADDSYHIDISHLAAVVRMSLLVQDRNVIALAADLTAYGRRLSPRLLFEGPPPFEKIFDDHAIYLHAVLGQDVETALAHFRGKLSAETGEEADVSPAAQILVNLLVQAGQVEAAIDVASQHLAGLPDSALACPSVAQLCQRAGQLERLAQIARDQKDLVTFTAALLQSQSEG